MTKIRTRSELLNFIPRNSTVAEVGVFKGDFSKIIYNTVKPYKMYLIDIFEGYMGSGNKDGENMEFVMLDDYFCCLKDFFKNENVDIIKSRSSKALSEFSNDYLDFVYIDASHEYEDIANDLSIAFEKIKNNGYIGGHDYDEIRFPGVFKAVNEFLIENNQKISYITEDKLPSFLIKINK